MESRVGRIALKLRLPHAERDRVEAMRRTVETIILQRALDELERAVHDRFGAHAIVRIRRLSARWRLDDADLREPATPIALGGDLAASVLAALDALPGTRRLRPDPDDSIVMFADEDHAVAALLADRADDRSAWFHASTGDPRIAWTTVVASGAERAAAVVRWLERMERRDEVRRWLDDDAVTSHASLAAPPRAEIAARPAAGAASTRVSDADRGGPAVRAAREGAIDPRAVATAAPPAATGDRAPSPSTDTDTDAAVVTRAAGVFYLARLVMQLELAEQLWAAGVREGEFLVHVAAAALGPDFDGDPAPRWFGGDPRGAPDRTPALDPLAPWAADELDALLGASLARDGLAPPPAALVAACAYRSPVGDDRTAHTIARSAAALVHAFAARLGIAPDAEAVRAYLRIRGVIEPRAPGESLRIVMPMAAIDVDIRRAGLDFNPGHLPWLGRAVEIVFLPTSDAVHA